MNKAIVVIHDNDRDGYGGAWAAREFFKNRDVDAKYIPMTDRFNPPYDEIPAGADVYLIDFSYLPETLDKLAENHNVWVLDHHISSARDFLKAVEEKDGTRYKAHDQFDNGEDFGLFSGRITYIFSWKYSGATLAWKFFHGTEAPAILTLITDWDNWVFEYTTTRPILMAFDWHGLSFETLDLFANHYEEIFSRELDRGYILLKQQDNYIDELLKTVDILKAKHLTYVVASVPPVFASEAGSKLLELHPEVDFSATLWWNPETDEFSVSLRSRKEDNVDVSVIAKANGGGGHRTAAGFKMASDERMSV